MLLPQPCQDVLVVERARVIVLLQLGQLRLPLAVQLDLGGRGVARLLQLLAQLLELAAEDLAGLFGLGAGAALLLQVLFQLLQPDLSK